MIRPISYCQGHKEQTGSNIHPTILSPALAAQHYDDQAVSGDAQGEDERVDHRQEHLLQVSSHYVLHLTGLLEFHPEVSRTRTRTRACVIVVVIQDDVLETDVRG